MSFENSDFNEYLNRLNSSIAKSKPNENPDVVGEEKSELSELEILKKRLAELEKQYEELLPSKGLSEEDDRIIESLENEITNLKGDIEKLENS
ncbi:MAG: hypothetical protein ACP5RX_02585 [Minisyncoccia bacterium]